MLTKLFRWLGVNQHQPIALSSKDALHRVVIPRTHHSISRKNISPSALKVLYRLESHGFEAYLVGGSVRDLLLGKHPKDFDIATNAIPEQVYRLFKNSRMIGRRFKLVHVFFGSHIVEVATFRAPALKTEMHSPHAKIQHSSHGMIVRDNFYGSLEEDVWRRDFTVNALYYTLADFSIIDYVDGLRDLEARCLRMIGDASLRYREDPVRMLRAIRFSAKLNFNIHPDTAKPIMTLTHLIHNVAPARLFEECLKLFFTGYAVKSFALLQQYGLLASLFPTVDALLKHEEKGSLAKAFVLKALEKTDARIAKDQPVAIPFLIATLLWPVVQFKTEEYEKKLGLKLKEAYREAMASVLKDQQKWIAIPKRIVQMTEDLWLMQRRLTLQNKNKVHTWFANPQFRGAYDFLILRAEAGDTDIEPMVAWWKAYIAANESTRLKMVTKNYKLKLKRKKQEENQKEDQENKN